MDEVSYSIVCCLYNEKNILEKKFEESIKFAKNIPFKKANLLVT